MNDLPRDPDGPITSEVIKHQLAYKPVYYTTQIPLVVMQKLGLSTECYNPIHYALIWNVRGNKVTVEVAKD